MPALAERDISRSSTRPGEERAARSGRLLEAGAVAEWRTRRAR